MTDRMLVCGGRKFSDRLFVWNELHLLRPVLKPRLLICGGATGVDSIAYAWGLRVGLPSCKMDAAWSAYGKLAGGLRNGWMIDLLMPNVVVVFPGGAGTADMRRRAEDCGIKIVQVEYRAHAQDD